MELIAVACLAFLLSWKWDAVHKARRLDHAFHGRDALTDEQFLERYFQHDGVSLPVAAGVRRVLAEQLDADLSRLSGTDNLSANLSFLLIPYSMDDVAIVEALEATFGIVIADAEATALRSVRDIVLLVRDKVRASAP